MIWTIGREREKLHAAQFAKSPEQQHFLFPVIDAVHDLKEGNADLDAFRDAARTAMTLGGYPAWTSTANWIRQVGKEYPEVLTLWDELAPSSDWRVRWRVACELYWQIPDQQSDRLFADLRHDRSKKVRETAVDRYEYRPDAKGSIEKRFDSSMFVPPEGKLA